LIVLKSASGVGGASAIHNKVGACNIDVKCQVVNATTRVGVGTGQSTWQVVEIEVRVLLDRAAEDFRSRWYGPGQFSQGRIRAERVIVFKKVKITIKTYPKLEA
jgi:hypothetical protein